MPQTLQSTNQPAVLVRHSCCSEGSYPARDHWLKAFDLAGAWLSYLVDLPRLDPQAIEVLQQKESGDWLAVNQIDARSEIDDDSIKPVALELALGAIRGIVDQQPGAEYDIFVTICHPNFLTSNTGTRELEMATGLADEGHRLYALISCQSGHISFGQALASSGGYELFRTTSVDGPVGRLLAKSRHKAL